MGILSKKTNNLLQSLSFIFKRDSRPYYEFSLLTSENFSSPDYYRFCNRWLERYLEFCPSCNRLVYVYNKSGDAAIRNNSTKEGISLPSHRKKGSSIVTGSAFGFDPKSEDYKVVRFVDKCITGEEVEDKDEQDCRSGVELYSFKSNSWKWISDFERVFFSPSIYLKGPSVYVNGRSFWKRGRVIVSFDFADEEFSRLNLPDIGKSAAEQKRLYGFDLLEFDGSLAAVVY
ncbi:hypothetical protein C2S53_004303 [Perilla frutescens var. hirtella]|uniref:F-box associated beta-propeller type 3 domain-containing protein n=1 Tax=Perilla frutescens var. hirtella TaxID=608512 RepID=A0AAD4IP09_PERFH|nr:hypothetical protein C2S53_004303 [Perilla frutescens var. hirtella]